MDELNCKNKMKNGQELPKNRKEMQDCEIMRDEDKKKIPPIL